MSEPTYTTIKAEDIKYFSKVSPGQEALIIELRDLKSSGVSASATLKSPKTGKEYEVKRNPDNDRGVKWDCRNPYKTACLAILDIDEGRKKEFTGLLNRLTKNTGNTVHYMNQLESLFAFIHHRCGEPTDMEKSAAIRSGKEVPKKLNSKILSADEMVAVTKNDDDMWLIVDTNKKKMRDAAFIMPYTIIKVGDRYEKFGKDGGYFIKGDDKNPPLVMSPEEFDRSFVSLDDRYTRCQSVKDINSIKYLPTEKKKRKDAYKTTAKVSTNSTFEQSDILADHYMKKYPNAFLAHEEGLVINTDEKMRNDTGFMAFIEDMGAMPENKSHCLTISTNMMYLRGRESIGKRMMKDLRKNGKTTTAEYKNFSQDMYFHERNGSQHEASNAPSSSLPWRGQENRDLPSQMSIFDFIRDGNIR